MKANTSLESNGVSSALFLRAAPGTSRHSPNLSPVIFTNKLLLEL